MHGAAFRDWDRAEYPKRLRIAKIEQIGKDGFVLKRESDGTDFRMHNYQGLIFLFDNAN
jgi:hypothetical protein